MPIGSYPRITLQSTSDINNNMSGTGLAIFNQDSAQYAIADSNLFPINNGGLASQDTLQSVSNSLISGLGPSVANLLYDTNTDVSAGNILGRINENLLATNYNGESAGNTLMAIFVTLSAIQSNLTNGTYSIQIKGSNGNLVNVSAANRLNVAL
jgi:hypothetical protein